MSVYSHFNYPSPTNSEVCSSNTPAFAHDSQSPIASSRITGHINCSVYAYNNYSNKLCRMPVHQLFSTDGRLFLEYKPGHNIVYVDNQIAADQPLKQAIKHALLPPPPPPAQGMRKIQKTRRKAQKLGMPKKPHNAFIRYRCRHLHSTRQAHPSASQTELSRIIADHWKTEPQETKELLLAEYRSELSQYQEQVRRFHAQQASQATVP
ncbi:hypothetical protein IWW38_001724 [Coemansia aciculifera]|uniref:Uncharacterized protein n=1 Tax=Coemansia aciculifera TaxID=417176 RepID=A0ACC1M793_9FUNG|nr:hypothetical protein IWW38_001724 [Coemansia aciculifera]